MFLRPLIISTLCAFVSPHSQAQMTTAEVKAILAEHNLGAKEVDKVLTALQGQLGSEQIDVLDISGVLTSKGPNFGFILDSDIWYFDATFVSPDSHQLVTLKNLYKVQFDNGGFKGDLSYKWMFVFVPAGMNIHSLDNIQYRRGIGISANLVFGLDVAWIPGEGDLKQLFLVAPKIGFGGGLTYPQMKFELQRPIETN